MPTRALSVRRILILSAGWLFIALGVLGLFLPFLQGVLFLMIGFSLLSLEFGAAASPLGVGCASAIRDLGPNSTKPSTGRRGAGSDCAAQLGGRLDVESVQYEAGRKRDQQNLAVDGDILMTRRCRLQLGKEHGGPGVHATDLGRYCPLAHFLAWPGGTNAPLLLGPTPSTLPFGFPPASSRKPDCAC